MTEGISHIALDDVDVWCLEDGTHVFEPSVFPGCAFEEQQTRLAAAGETEIRTVFNAYLIKSRDGAMTLMDCGCGTHYGAAAGFLLGRLDALGVRPGDITRLVITHLHTDHYGGAWSDGVPTFPNAELVLSADEVSNAAGDEIAEACLAAYAGRTRTIAAGEAIAEGFETVALPGHTPGHFGLKVGGQLFLVGDVFHSEALQLGDPRLCPVYDRDPPSAVDSRLSALREVADRGMIFSGSHMLGPNKFARLVEIGDGFVRVDL